MREKREKNVGDKTEGSWDATEKTERGGGGWRQTREKVSVTEFQSLSQLVQAKKQSFRHANSLLCNMWFECSITPPL